MIIGGCGSLGISLRIRRWSGRDCRDILKRQVDIWEVKTALLFRFGKE